MSEERNFSVRVLRFSQQYISGFRYGLLLNAICPKKANQELPQFPETVDTVSFGNFRNYLPVNALS